MAAAVYKGDPLDFSPRVGFAYDVTGKGTTVIRGGASVMYSTFAIASFVGNPGSQNIPGGASLAKDPTGACTTAVGIGTPCPQTLGGNIEIGTVRVPGGSLNWNGVVYPTGVTFACTAANPCNAGAIDPNLKNPYIVNYNLGVQHQFGEQLLVGGWLRRQSRRQADWVHVDINQCPPSPAASTASVPSPPNTPTCNTSTSR